MKGRENESEECVQRYETLFYGMSGVGNQTNSTVRSIKRDFIWREVDGKGIWIS